MDSDTFLIEYLKRQKMNAIENLSKNNFYEREFLKQYLLLVDSYLDKINKKILNEFVDFKRDTFSIK